MRSCIQVKTCYSGYHFKYAAKGGAQEHTAVHKGLWWGHEKEKITQKTGDNINTDIIETGWKSIEWINITHQSTEMNIVFQ